MAAVRQLGWKAIPAVRSGYGADTLLDRYRVIVVDDLGYVKRDSAETGVLFELIAHRYERGSLVITSNHPFSMWGSIFVDETMAVAAADRLIHHGYMFELKGESYRKKTAKAVTSVT